MGLSVLHGGLSAGVPLELFEMVFIKTPERSFIQNPYIYIYRNLSFVNPPLGLFFEGSFS